MDDTEGTADDMYILIGTHVLTIYPPAQDPTDGIVDCVNTPVDACTDDTFSTTATNPTGGAAIANWDGTSYTAQPGDLVGTMEIIVTTTNGCTETFTITTPACPGMSPAPIPTMSQWGLMIYGLLILNFGLILIRRKSWTQPFVE